MKWWQIRKRTADLERELRSDLELEEEEQRENGLSPEEARYAARRAFGNPTLIREQTHEAWGWAPFERLWQDVRYAFRQFGRKPGFVVVSVITLALGIGATTTIYSIADSLLLRPLPYPNSPRIVRVWNTFAPRGMMETSGIRARIPGISSEPQLRAFCGILNRDRNSNRCSSYPLRTAASWGTSDFFQVMGTEPLIGRVFTPDEFQPGQSQVAVLSHRLWQSRFGATPDIVGKSFLLNGQSCTIVGIMPRASTFPSNDVDVWQPLPIPPASENLGNHYLNLIGELKRERLCNKRDQNWQRSRSPRTQISNILRRCSRNRREPYSAAPTNGRQRASDGIGSDDRRRISATNRVHECRRPYVGPRRRPPARNRDQSRTRRLRRCEFCTKC